MDVEWRRVDATVRVLLNGFGAQFGPEPMVESAYKVHDHDGFSLWGPQLS